MDHIIQQHTQCTQGEKKGDRDSKKVVHTGWKLRMMVCCAGVTFQLHPQIIWRLAYACY